MIHTAAFYFTTLLGIFDFARNSALRVPYLRSCGHVDCGRHGDSGPDTVVVWGVGEGRWIPNYGKEMLDGWNCSLLVSAAWTSPSMAEGEEGSTGIAWRSRTHAESLAGGKGQKHIAEGGVCISYVVSLELQ
jgi:hypothetical protein